jgi:putative membrane protein
MAYVLSWLINAVAILIAAYLLPGINVSGFWAALVLALVLGIMNTILKPILIILTLPVNILTLGLFTFVINALLVLLAAAIVPGFAAAGFWWALLFSLVLSVISWAMSAIAK